MRKLTHIEFLNRITDVGQDIEVLEEYKGRFTKILVKDKLGIIYLSNPDKLLEGKRPSLWTAINKNTAFGIKAIQIHADRYCYDFVKYINDKTKVKILCLTHGLFEQTPSNHLRGQGCPKCGEESARLKWAENGFNRTQWIAYCNDNNKQAKLYIIECFNDKERFIKIGITTRTMEARFWKSNMPYKYNIISLLENKPEVVYDKEKGLHRRFKQYKYIPILDFDGYRECFEYEILKLL